MPGLWGTVAEVQINQQEERRHLAEMLQQFSR